MGGKARDLHGGLEESTLSAVPAPEHDIPKSGGILPSERRGPGFVCRDSKLRNYEATGPARPRSRPDGPLGGDERTRRRLSGNAPYPKINRQPEPGGRPSGKPRAPQTRANVHRPMPNDGRRPRQTVKRIGRSRQALNRRGESHPAKAPADRPEEMRIRRPSKQFMTYIHDNAPCTRNCSRLTVFPMTFRPSLSDLFSCPIGHTSTAVSKSSQLEISRLSAKQSMKAVHALCSQRICNSELAIFEP